MNAVYGSSHRHHVPERDTAAAADAVTRGQHDLREVIAADFDRHRDNLEGSA